MILNRDIIGIVTSYLTPEANKNLKLTCKYYFKIVPLRNLKFTGYIPKYPLNYFNGVNSITVKSSKKISIPPVHTLKKLILEYSHVQNISKLRNLTYLIINSSPNTQYIKHKGLKKLGIANSKINLLAIYKNLTHLSLINCTVRNRRPFTLPVLKKLLLQNTNIIRMKCPIVEDVEI